MKSLIEYISENMKHTCNDILDPIFDCISKKSFSINHTMFGHKASIAGMHNAKLFSFDAAEISNSYVFDNCIDKLRQEWKSKELQFKEIELATNQSSLKFSFDKQNIIIVIYQKGIYVSHISIYIESSDKSIENVINDFTKTL